MGNHENKAAAGAGQDIYCLKQREIRIMTEIWKSVETDLVYYGTQFYSLLLSNHPEYVKYFHENKPHEFQVDVPAMRTKFSLTCSTLATLFVEYSHKPQPRENLLGYVAMVHKDMNLNQKDMENFMMDMMEMLMQNFPKLMTAECCLAYIRYTSSLTSRLHLLMKNQREDARTNGGSKQKPKQSPILRCFHSSNYTWLPCHHQNLIYGRTADYWEQKSRHWIVQRAMWATTHGENRSNPSGKDIISKNSIVNISQTSIIEDSTSSDESRSDRAVREKSIRRRKQFRKQINSSTPSNDHGTDIGAKIIPKSSDFLNGDRGPLEPEVRQSLKTAHATKSANNSQILMDKNEYWPKEVNRGRRSRVSIVNSTARERRRRNLREEFSAEVVYPRPATRRLTIQSEIETRKYTDDSSSSSSPDEAGERDFHSNNSIKPPNVSNNKMRDRGTSISNVPNHSDTTGEYKSTETTKRSYADERPRTSIFISRDPPSSIIGPAGTAAGRNIKTNKRVSISNAQWFAPSEFDQ